MNAETALNRLSAKLRVAGFRLPIALYCAQKFCHLNQRQQHFDEPLKQAVADWLLSAFDAANGVAVSSSTWPQLKTIQHQQFRDLLGQELDFVLIDGCDDFSANAVAALAGTIRAGGVLLMLAPEQSVWETLAHAEQLRLFGRYLSKNSRFLQRVGESFLQPECLRISLLEDQNESLSRQFDSALDQASSGVSQPLFIASLNAVPDQPGASQFTINTDEQQRAIESIKRVFTGHAKRHLVMLADRGRGKSSALGIAAAHLVAQTDKCFCITAPSRGATEQVFRWFQRSTIEQEQKRLSFMPVDQVIHALQEKRFNFDGLIIDEAAAIPVAQLDTMLKLFNRIVFTSTVHGYEGTGRGFTLRFLPKLLKHAPQTQQVELKQPIRWAEGDPLEYWINRLFQLKPESRSERLITEEGLLAKPLEFAWFAPNDQVSNSVLLEAFQLLVDAHYQTTPDDFRQLLEHPDRYLGMLLHDGHVVAVALVLQEGGMAEPMVSQVARGERRLRGHLVAQSLAFHCQQPALAKQNSWRVQRIAVLPEFQAQGIGSSLLSQIKTKAAASSVDFISTSFALTDDVVKFWLRNHFQPIRLGLSFDKVSGCHSCLMIYPLADNPMLDDLVNEFYPRTKHLASSCYQSVAASILSTFWLAKKRSSEDVKALNSSELKRLQQLTEFNLGFDDAILYVDKLLASHLQYMCEFDVLKQLELSKLDSAKPNRSRQVSAEGEPPVEAEKLAAVLEAQALLVAKCWQQKSLQQLIIEFQLQGKKELDQQLKMAVATILSEQLYLGAHNTK